MEGTVLQIKIVNGNNVYASVVCKFKKISFPLKLIMEYKTNSINVPKNRRLFATNINVMNHFLTF
jgi:hypothetical protein